jgi:transposase
MRTDRSFQLIEAVPLDGAPVSGRRRWSEAFKADAVERSFAPGTNVSALAREIGISPAQLFGWRTAAQGDRSEAERDGAPNGSSGVIEIVIAKAVIRVGADIDEDHLGRVIRAVRSA